MSFHSRNVRLTHVHRQSDKLFLENIGLKLYISAHDWGEKWIGKFSNFSLYRVYNQFFFLQFYSSLRPMVNYFLIDYSEEITHHNDDVTIIAFLVQIIHF